MVTGRVELKDARSQSQSIKAFNLDEEHRVNMSNKNEDI